MDETGKVHIGSNIKDTLYKYLQNPIKENFSSLIDNGTGEHNCIDFKLEWIKDEKLIKEILGIANSGGGVIIFGIKEEKGKAAVAEGLQKFEEKSDINKRIQHYLPSTIKYDVHNFEYDEKEYAKLANKKFQVLAIEHDPVSLPYVAEKSTGNIQTGMIFIRRGTNVVLANNNEVHELIKKKIGATYSTQSNLELKAHLDQLKTLYLNVDKNKSIPSENSIFNFTRNSLGLAGLLSYSTIENENYPKEDFEDFIVKMIELKKNKIEKVLDLK